MTDLNNLLLLSSSVVHGGGYLDYALEEISSFSAGRTDLLFAPFASADHDGYTARVAQTLEPFGFKVRGLHSVDDPVAALNEASMLFVGGGNSFRLVKALHDRQLIQPIRELVASGELSYMGASAGSNMACPTMRTTNDMPIVQPPSFNALDLIPFQINPHYVDPVTSSTHMGETREQRITEFLEENDVPVLGLREGAWLRRQGKHLRLGGFAGARLFRRHETPAEIETGADLSALLTGEYRFDV